MGCIDGRVLRVYQLPKHFAKAPALACLAMQVASFKGTLLLYFIIEMNCSKASDAVTKGLQL